MTRRLSALLLAMTMVFQLVAPQASIAKQGTKKTNGSGAKIAQQDKKKYRKIGVINGNSYDGKVMNALNREAAKNRKMKKAAPGISLFSAGPYFGDNNEPTDANKPKYYGNINVDFKLSGLDGNPFQWNEIFGVDEKGNPKSAQIIFVQTDDETGNETGVQYILKVTQTGKYTWSDVNGNPTKLPLFSKALKPYNYEARVDEDVAENIKLLTARMTGTEGANPTFSPENADGEIIANITLDLGLQQVASTKFKSEWKTGVEETKRPQIQGSIAEKVADLYDQPVVFDLPKNNKDAKIIRDWEDAFEDGLMVADALYKTPTVKLVETNANGLTFDTTNKTVKSGDHKYKYDFKYDVIKGGKLTMTEVIPVTFDANGGKFASIEEGKDQKIAKEVDYDGTLKDKAEEPKKDRETFKGWGTKDAQGKINPVTDADFAKIQSAKTFYAIWDNNAITADELTVHESYNDGTKYVNDFIPTLDTLKGQVKIKDGSGKLQKLEDGDKFAIVDGTKEYTADGDALKTYLYEKLQEKKNPKDEPTRIETVKAKVTHANGTSQTVDIPIKVVKNIYEAKTLTDRPYYVPTDYVKVIVDPTTKAKDPQKTYYYVNPEAKVVIPGEDPTGTDGNQFTKWLIKGTKTEYKLSEHPRYQFSGETTIEAQYVSDVISPNEDGSKPDTVPKNYVEVKFVPTDKATDATKAEKIFWVNPEKKVTIPVANPVGKTYYTFKEWKVGVNAEGAVYKPNEAQKFEQATTITATYDESKNIIPYDPSAADPMVRPEGYVRVTFAADPGLKLKEQKAYYVKKNANIKLGDPTLVKPKYEPETGYKFKEWDKDDTTPIGANDIVVTAKATPLDEFIPQKNTDGTDKPKGYVTVTFVADKNGEIRDNGTKVDKKVYYVNPNKFVKLPAPTPVGNTGYDFAAWRSDQATGDFSLANFVNYTKDTVITAKFNQKDAVYPKLDGSTKPAGYVEVTFKINGTDGSIPKGEVTTYYVDPTRQVSLKAPKTMAGTGFIFDKWRLGTNPTDPIINPADQKQYTVNTTIYGSFTKLKDIIPATNQDGTPNLQPIDYVAVLFIGGDHANSVDGQILYYVNPKANPAKTIRDLTKPTVKPDTGWKHTGWDVQDSTVINDYTFVVAQYDAIADVIPKTKADDSEKPAGYVEVKFVAGKNGKIQEKGADIAEKVYYVNPAKYVNLTPPTTVPNDSYEFSTWKSDGKDFILANNIRFTTDTTITAKFNPVGDVIPETKPDGSANVQPPTFVKVTFVIDPAEGGNIDAGEISTYFVNPAKDVTIHPPKTTANTGYEFKKWSIDTTTANKYATDTTVKGEFEKLADIIPSKNPDGTINAKPEGYVTVQFLKGDHGVLDGQTTFYVNPKAKKTLNDLDISGITVVPNPTYKHDGWDTDFATVIDKDTKVTAKYTQLPAIIKAGPKDTAPAGYVVIIFETDGRGTITGNAAYEDKTNPKTNENEIVYFVNPKKGIKLAKADAKASETVLPVPSTAPYDATKYEFDQWRTTIDTDTSITRGRVHIAMFKPKQVTLTYVANGATGTVPPELTVDYDANVRLAGKGDLTKKDASFKGWKIGDTIYQAGDQINLKDNKTAYAQWDDDKKIIEYDPVKDPTTRPDDTYVRVTFAADPGLKLTQQKAYYVKQNAKDEHGTALTLASLTKPGVSAETGYKFKEWDKEDTTVIGTGDIVVTAKAASIPEFVEKTNEHPNKPDDKYVTVTFKADNSGNGTVTEKTYFVNPNKYVTLTPPDDAKGKTGYEFGSWSQDAKIPTVYDKDTTITASFNETKAVIPNKNPDGSVNKQPAGYVTVTFKADIQGQIPADEITVYYVDPNRDVIINPPTAKGKTGYEFEKWDRKTIIKQKYGKNTTVTASFTKLDDIVDGSKPKPAGYVTVKFYKGDHGELTGQTVFYVNPEAKKTFADITKPTVKQETGWEFVGWPVSDTDEIKGNFDITASYDEIADVVPKDNPKGGENKIPDNYITVTFSTEENGKIKDTTNTKTQVVYVNPNKAVVLKSYAPEVTPNTGFDFADWDTQIDKRIQYSNGDTIKALYNAKDDVIPQGKTDGTDKPAGYLTVKFERGEHGTLSGKTVYYVKPNKEVTVPAPTVTPKTGFKQKDGKDAWDKLLTQTFTKDTTITAQYDPIKDVIPQKNTDGSDRPSGYKTVRFVGEHGTLSVDTVFYVNPEKGVDFTDTVKGFTKTPDFSYTDVGGTWNEEIKSQKFIDDKTFTFTFKKLDNIIPEKKPDGTTNAQPKGYVKVTLIPTAKATDNTKENKVFFVNPKETVEIKNKPIGKEITAANGSKSSFKFIGWTVTRGSIASWTGETISGKFIEETEITAKYEFAWISIVKEPIAEENVVTGKGDKPNPEDLIKNKYDKGDPTNTNNLPEGTTFTYEEDPKVDNAGNITAKVKVEYPGGATTIVEVPITVVDHVVPQIGGENGKKPLVPDSYVKVIVDTTDKAVDNTKFKKVFWVKPDVKVTIPGIKNPTGKKETDANGVTKTNNFVKWQREDDPAKSYDKEITDTFTAKESKIIATYEQDKNVDPVPNSGQWIPKGSDPLPKDFIKNPYNDDDPDNSSNLPSGTKIEFDGPKPDTSTEAKGKSVTIKITYPNGEVRKVPITYNVTGDVVEQPNPDDPTTKPVVPDEFVKVIVDKTEKAQLAAGENRTQVFWVNPTKTVTIPVDAPTANKEDMVFTKWDSLLTQQFTAKETTITAKFSKKQKPIEPLPTAGYVITERGVLPKPDDYKKVITPPAGKTIKRVAVVTEPNVNKGGMTTAKVSVTYEDNTTVQIPVQVFVQNKEQPYPTPQPDPIPQPYPTPQPNFVPYPVPGETKTVYKDRTVLRREVRYMQGFEGKFRPDDGLTRAEAAQILANALKEDGYPFDLRYKLPYKDTTKEMWYNDAVRITTQADVFIGYDDGEFKPQRKITRAEWIATLRRFQYVDKVGGNSLHMRKNHWAIPEVEAAYRNGWLSIYTEKKAPFNYDEPISRKEVAAVSNRAFRRVRDMDYIRRNDKFMINYTDINRDMWAYDDILCASNTFLHQRQGAYIAYKRGDKAYTIDVKDAIIEQDLFQRIPRHR